MIKIRKLFCSYNGRTVLDIPSLTINKPGLYVFFGPSGCGKTTLLNILQGLNQDYGGEVIVYYRNLRRLCDVDMVSFRATFISTFFQHGVFIDNLTLLENIRLVADVSTRNMREIVDKKVKKLANELEIETLLNRQVKKLSGGERTRGAIARSILKECSLYLFDEPTAALDERNAEVVMRKLKILSQNKVVILVTHDQKIANQFADKIFYMAYGKIVDEQRLNTNENINKSEFIKKRDYKNNANIISKGLLKAKKRRHIITGFFANFSFLILGLSSLLVRTVNHKLVSAMQGNFNENTTFVEQLFVPAIKTIKSIETDEISRSFPYYNIEIGSLYLNNLDEFFPDLNGLSFHYNGRKYMLPSFHINLFNEAISLSEFSKKNSLNIDGLAHDEIGLVLPLDDFKLIQNIIGLPYKNNEAELNLFLIKNNITITLEAENKDWEYYDEQSFHLQFVALGSKACVIVGNLSEIENLFENKMLLPASVNLTKIEEYPWTLKKVAFLSVNDGEDFLWQNIYHSKYMFQLAKKGYFRSLEDEKLLNNRIIVYERPPYFNDILYEDFSGSPPHFYTFLNGLSFISDMMSVGFTSNFFLGSDESILHDVVRLDQDEKETLNVMFDLPSSVINLAIQYNSFSTYGFKNNGKSFRLNEVAISRGLAQKLFTDDNAIGRFIYGAALTNIEDNNAYYLKHYERFTLEIMEVIDDDNLVIYHHPLWAYLLYKDVFSISPFALPLSGALLDEYSLSEQATNKFQVRYPFREFKQTLDVAIGEIKRYSTIISLSTVILSAVLIFMIVYLLIEETQDQFYGLYLVGYTRENISDIVRYYILYFVGGIMLLSLIQLFLFSFIIEGVLSKIFLSNFVYRFIFAPYLVLFTVGSVFILILLKIFSFFIKRLNMLQQTKKDL